MAQFQEDAHIGRTYEKLWDERSIRIDDKKVSSYQPSYHTDKGPDNKFAHAAVRGIHEKTLLNQLYFSQKNIKNIQNKLRYTVYKMSRGQFTIGNQNETELQIVMRSIFLQFGKNLPTNIKGQIANLNELVVDDLSPKVLSQTKQYIKYLEDINEPYRPIQRPQNVSSAGSKVLEMHTALGFGDPDFKPFQ